MSRQKREINGQYAFDGNLERMCACGHALANHSAGSPADCLLYSLPQGEREALRRRLKASKERKTNMNHASWIAIGVYLFVAACLLGYMVYIARD